MRVRRVRREEIARAVRAPWADPSRRPYVEGENACVPVREGYACDGELPERQPYRGRPFQMIGDTAVVRGRRPTEDEVAAILAWRRPACVLYLAAIEGVRRLPAVEALYGEQHQVLHRENGIRYRLNPAEVMYAAGNLEERARMGRSVREGERVADMFAGIGYFALPMAAAGAAVHAMEINPVSFGYLTGNVTENGLSEQVRAECGDCRTLLAGTYDRIVMGHFDALSFLPDALAHARAGTALHLHALGDVSGAVRASVETAGFEVGIVTRKVKKYGPHIWHIVHDLVLS
ncbi:MAG: tRNA wybutosine-synthesizing protein 2 [Methanofollis sp.]|nr:tRNA wybutosine-synthesizing protein 2 [Methanofollis sp.]